MDVRSNHCYQELCRELSSRCRERDRETAELIDRRDISGIKKRAAAVREHMRRLLSDGSFSRCPLNAQKTGEHSYDGFTLENLLIETLPGFLLPVNVYRPEDGAKKHPAAVVCMGHWPDGKAMEENRIMCANLAKNGVLCATFDPVMQGERLSYTQEELSAIFGDMTVDMWMVGLHMLPGNLAYLMSREIAALFTWEAVRVTDMLCEREDVDISRIAATGQSGGGTQSIYLAAADERISYCSPIQCISKQALIVEASGIGDCEQSMAGMSGENALDYPDMLWAVYPRPMMVSSGKNDMYFLSGVLSVEAELRLLYERTGIAENYEHAMADCAHAISPETRAFSYDWLSRKLMGKPALSEREPGVSMEDTRCFPEGVKPVATRELYIALLREEQALRPHQPEKVREGIARLLDICADSYTVERQRSCGGYGRVTLHTAAHRRIDCALKIAQSDLLTVVIAPDTLDVAPFEGASTLVLTPWGMETAYAKKRTGYDEETCIFNAATVLGQNIMRQRATQIACAIDYALKVTGACRIRMAGGGAGATVALLYAAADGRVERTALIDAQVSLDDMFAHEPYFLPETSILPGMLQIADIPEIAKAVGAVFINPRDYKNEPAEDGRVSFILSEQPEREAARYLAK